VAHVLAVPLDSGTAEFLWHGTHRTTQVLDYQILQIIRQYLCWT